uniref:Putative endocytic adaptor protein intersectin n=1 Tax=Lutzomyia longipalpis TaxID=7200 RepID=A0A7G3AGU0_LUTLO
MSNREQELAKAAKRSNFDASSDEKSWKEVQKSLKIAHEEAKKEKFTADIRDKMNQFESGKCDREMVLSKEIEALRIESERSSLNARMEGTRKKIFVQQRSLPAVEEDKKNLSRMNSRKDTVDKVNGYSADLKVASDRKWYTLLMEENEELTSQLVKASQEADELKRKNEMLQMHDSNTVMQLQSSLSRLQITHRITKGALVEAQASIRTLRQEKKKNLVERQVSQEEQPSPVKDQSTDQENRWKQQKRELEKKIAFYLMELIMSIISDVVKGCVVVRQGDIQSVLEGLNELTKSLEKTELDLQFSQEANKNLLKEIEKIREQHRDEIEAIKAEKKNTEDYSKYKIQAEQLRVILTAKNEAYEILFLKCKGFEQRLKEVKRENDAHLNELEILRQQVAEMELVAQKERQERAQRATQEEKAIQVEDSTTDVIEELQLYKNLCDEFNVDVLTLEATVEAEKANARELNEKIRENAAKMEKMKEEIDLLTAQKAQMTEKYQKKMQNLMQVNELRAQELDHCRKKFLEEDQEIVLLKELNEKKTESIESLSLKCKGFEQRLKEVKRENDAHLNELEILRQQVAEMELVAQKERQERAQRATQEEKAIQVEESTTDVIEELQLYKNLCDEFNVDVLTLEATVEAEKANARELNEKIRENAAKMEKMKEQIDLLTAQKAQMTEKYQKKMQNLMQVNELRAQELDHCRKKFLEEDQEIVLLKELNEKKTESIERLTSILREKLVEIKELRSMRNDDVTGEDPSPNRDITVRREKRKSDRQSLYDGNRNVQMKFE